MKRDDIYSSTITIGERNENEVFVF